ncbi:arginine--tRNA ligase [Clostridium celatum]|uniref:arginine--tRNA ligase n=1 Tax=Clostridium celatum TaxID=36834 RepID=UPI001896F2D0|nr:arginine--tRNA ligase [Clostridium celatum]MCE9656838.1 arginine--tRNA ligase [Clostridium celatum]MDU2265029.1 arginine--tRNA ligase [Clostridium celatum]MDU3723814.1 arginine--tRNA ligase [Clostridium celatum]MDU6294521.1 arginine--tRNA ligase [Clostridium celatum]MDY3359478.1 arginine--tRNA ligase [Clostridium celatum]
MKIFIEQISDIFMNTFEELGYDKSAGKVNVSNRPDLCQYQCNGALACAKKYKKAPNAIAQEVVEKLKENEIFSKLEIAGPGFINITLNDEFLVDYVNKMNTDERFGTSQATEIKKIIVDYGGANVAKPLHIGHLRSAIIGESIKRIAKYLGHDVIGDVHLGDWGLQMGMVISEVERRNPSLPYFDESFEGEYPEEAPFTIDELEDIYPYASKLAKSDEAVMEAAKKATVELQQGRRGYVALWKHILNVSVNDLKKNYGALDVSFELWNGESDAQKFIPEMIESLKEKGFAKESEGALVFDVSEETDKSPVPPLLLLKSDGASLYGTTDLATVVERVRDLKADEIIYLADKRQGLHYEQFFRAAKKSGIANENTVLDFIGFGTMNGKDGKPFKTREGGVMRLADLINLIKEAGKEKLKDNKNIAEEDVEEISSKVGLAALKYGDLSNQASKDYIFDIERFASFEGNTGPYILYTIVRIKSILNRANMTDMNKAILVPQSETERNLMLQLIKFNEVIELSFRDRAPHKICEYIYELSNNFNRFYNDTRIVSEEDESKKASWLVLINLVKNVLEQCLDLLGMESVERM